MAVRKKSKAIKKKEPSSNAADAKEKPVVVSDTVVESTERVEIIEEVTSETKLEPDPLTDFKEKMVEEEKPESDVPPQKNFMWPIIFVFIIAVVLLGGIFFYKQGTKTEKVNVVSVANIPTVTPEPTKIDLSKYGIKILNGSGIEGEGSRQKISLTGEGFTVSAVGNADNSNYTDTIIKAKKEVETGFVDKLKSVLGSTFTLGTTEILPDDAQTPVIVILGTKK